MKKYIGVYHQPDGKHFATSMRLAQGTFIGLFDTAKEAAEAYDAWHIRKAKERGTNEPKTNKSEGLL